MDRRPGTYVLILRALRSQTLVVGRLGRLELRPGWYLYVGSAFGPGGLEARLALHARCCCQAVPRAHWHIDYLRPIAQPRAVWYTTDRERHELRWARALAAAPQLSIPLRGFGASDSSAPAHLFYSRTAPAFEEFAPLLRRAVAPRRIVLQAQRWATDGFCKHGRRHSA